MLKYFVPLALTAILASAQNGADVLTNETIIKMVQAGVPTATIIKTIAAADKVDFRFIGPDLQRLVVDAKVPDEVFKAMAARDKGRPISVDTSAPSARPSTPTQSPYRVEPQKQGTRTDIEAGLTNDSMVKLVKAGMGEDVILGMVNSQPGRYNLTTDSLIALKQAGVSDKIIAAMVNRNAGSTRDQEPAQKKSFAAAQNGPSVSLAAAAVSHSTGSEPRVFLQSSSKGTNRNAARDQSMEMSKDLEKDCPGVRITINQQVADYTVLLNHIEVGLVVRDNQIQVANKDGDLISRTKEGGSIAAGMKKACALILADWVKK